MPSEYERLLKEEIWGCYKYIGLPFETIYSMPIQDRKYYIMKHNQEQEASKNNSNNTKNGNVISSEAINKYASITQQNIKNNRKM